MANDHYVPQFYLRNFQIDTKGSKSQVQPNHIYSYKRGLTPKAMAVRRLASEIDFDTISEGEEKYSSDHYNKLLKSSEDVTPPIISKVIESSTLSVSESDIEALSWFIALLAIRTPSSLKYFQQDILRFHRDSLRPMIRKDCMTNRKKIYQILRAENPDASDEEVESVIAIIADDEISWTMHKNNNNKAYLRQTGNAYLVPLVNSLMSKNWHLLIAPSGSSFVTSDNPVSFLVPRAYYADNRLTLSCPVFLPISPQLALYLHDYKFLTSSLRIDKEQVSQFVDESISHAEHSIFSNTKCDRLQMRFDDSHFDLANLNFEYNFMPYEEMKGLTIAAWKHFANVRND